MSQNNPPQDEEQTPSDAEAQINTFLSELFGNMFSNMDRRLDELSARYDAAKQALDEGDSLPLQREWEQLEGENSEGDMALDDHMLKIAHLWSGHLVKGRRWQEAEEVMKSALAHPGTGGRTLQKFESLLSLADVLRIQGKNEEAYTLLHEHPLTLQIEKISRSFPGSDNGARLAQARFDYAEEARLHLLAFAPSPLLSIPSLQEELGGDTAIRRLKAALAYYYAGQISNAVQQAEQALAASESEALKMAALCLLMVWQAPRQGWEGVAGLMNEAQSRATSPALAAQVMRLRLMEAMQTGDFALFEELGAQSGDDVATQQQYAELRALQGRFSDAREWVEILMEGAHTSDSSVDNHRRRALALLTHVMVELYAIQCGESWDAESVQRFLGHAREMLRGDVKVTLWIRAYEAAFLAAQGKRDEALQIADELVGEWEKWSDDDTTLKVLSSYLGTAFLSLGLWDKAVLWFERYLKVGLNPIYRAHYLELLARALDGNGEATEARLRRQEVVDLGLDIAATSRAQRALEN